MRHRVQKIKLNKPRDHRYAMVRNLLTSLFAEGQIKTTDAKATVVKAEAEKLITAVRRSSDAHNKIRTLQQTLYTEDAQRRAMDYIAIAPQSGAVRCTKCGHRAGDSALLSHVELINA
ncbi:50S ribosomal protein L17 [Candidatus Peribacteria bacterium]|nr:50S ribosomal protein L17 [Candidatus Peribacteria bacterium]